MITIILPAYNEADNIVLLIERIQKIAKRRLLEGTKIIVVDDGSSDETVTKVQEITDKNVLLVKHEKNKGLGEAIKQVFSQHSLCLIMRMLSLPWTRTTPTRQDC